MLFETKKIRTETLGEYLKAVRTTFNLSLPEVAEASGVNSKILKALETGNMSALPADIYVFGVLKQLADFYKLPEAELLTQLKKEREIARKIKPQKIILNKRTFKQFWGRLVITPKVLALLVAASFIVVTLLYLVWQVSAINRAPKLEIFSPRDQEIISSLSVEVKGETDPGSQVSVNGQEIFSGDNGQFSVKLSLTPGGQDINVMAQSRFGKQNSKFLKIFISAPEGLAAKEGLVLKLNFSGAVSLTVLKDGGKSEEKQFVTGESLEVIAGRQIVISANDGGQIQGSLNGQDLGTLGKKGEPLTELTFSAESGNIK